MKSLILLVGLMGFLCFGASAQSKIDQKKSNSENEITEIRVPAKSILISKEQPKHELSAPIHENKNKIIRVNSKGTTPIFLDQEIKAIQKEEGSEL